MEASAFQYQFKAITILVQGIEVAARIAVEAGAVGFPVPQVQMLADSFRLSHLGCEVLVSLIQQSDVLSLSADGAYLVPKLAEMDQMDILEVA